MKPRNDNLPERATAHTVRRLVLCEVCGGFGDKHLMIDSSRPVVVGTRGAVNKKIIARVHTSCAVETMTAKQLLALPTKERGKIRLRDLEKLSRVKRDAVLP